MKFPLLVLLCTCCFYSHAQTCSTHLLFKKGARLEYDRYTVPRGSSFPWKIMRLVFEVTKTEERNGSTYSTIVKKGRSLKSKNDHFQRTIELTCDGRNLLMPFDFYTPDTIYLKDEFFHSSNEGYAEAFLPLENDVTYNIPLNMQGVDSLLEGVKTYVEKGNHRGFDQTSLIKEDYENPHVINSIKLAGKETIKTAAGSFSCYKFAVEGTVEYNKYKMELKYWLYFNNDIGLVKMEGEGGSIELAKIKK